MFYNKPKIKYTEMCIYIDNTIYKEDITEAEKELVYKYLYHLCYMFASKYKYFNNVEYYEDFALYMASQIYLRLTNPKQFEYNEQGLPKLKKVKSVLNYIKSTLYAMKVDFEKESYSQIISYDKDGSDKKYEATGYSFFNQLEDSVKDLKIIDFNLCVNQISTTVRNYMNKIPYKTDPKTWHNIYISCLISLLNCFTLPNRDISKLGNLSHTDYVKNIEKCYSKENCNTNVVLYHLEDNMKNYIDILVRELKHLIAKDLSSIIYEPVTAPELKIVKISCVDDLGVNNET